MTVVQCVIVRIEWGVSGLIPTHLVAAPWHHHRRIYHWEEREGKGREGDGCPLQIPEYATGHHHWTSWQPGHVTCVCVFSLSRWVALCLEERRWPYMVISLETGRDHGRCRLLWPVCTWRRRWWSATSSFTTTPGESLYNSPSYWPL